VGRASRIASTPRGVLYAVTGRWFEFSDEQRPFLDLGDKRLELPGYECVYDLAVAGDRVAVLFDPDPLERDGKHRRALTTTTLAFEDVQHEMVSEAVQRVAITQSRTVLATNDGVELDGFGGLQRGPIVDLAATERTIAVLGPSGVTFYDDVGREWGGVDLFAPTAIAADPIDGGWLVAVDGGIAHLPAENLIAPKIIAPVAEPVRKVRRDREAVYVLVGRELRAIRGEHVEVIGKVEDNAWYWSDFDAGIDGFVKIGQFA
jgi:hypothetical protein